VRAVAGGFVLGEILSAEAFVQARSLVAFQSAAILNLKKYKTFSQLWLSK
jgi:hypothetical protein